MSTQAKRVDLSEYKSVSSEQLQDKPASENDIRVSAFRPIGVYIKYVLQLLKGEDGRQPQTTVKISGMGAAIYSVVNIAEIVKRRVLGLHQTTELTSKTVINKYQKKDDPNKIIDIERYVNTILITLSTEQLDTKHIGYQAPLPASEITEEIHPRERGPRHEFIRGGRGFRGDRGRGRGGRGFRGDRGGSRGRR